MRWLAKLKGFIPRPLHYLYNSLVSRHIIQRRLGSWFDADWKRHSGQAAERDWVKTYDRSWREHKLTDLTRLDLDTISAEIPQDSTILDVGCGDGLLLSHLAPRSRIAVGCDISHAALLLARERLGKSFPLVQCNMERLPFRDASFAAITSAHTLEHVRDLGAATGELKRVGERLIVLVPIQDYLPYTEDYHLQFFHKEDDLRDAFGLPEANVRRYGVPAGEGLFSGDVLLLTGNTGAAR